jgi:hypothetical protein
MKAQRDGNAGMPKLLTGGGGGHSETPVSRVIAILKAMTPASWEADRDRAMRILQEAG